ncbi:MAG: hypothetical protein ACKVPX_00780 [Myxococcaceae bacterium]
MADDLLSLPLPAPDAVSKLDLSPMRLLQDGWDFVKPYYLETMGMVLAGMVFSGVLAKIPLLGMLLGVGIGAAVSAGVVYFLLGRYRGDSVGFDAALIPIREKAVDIILTHALSTLAIIVGFFLLVIPGILAMALFAFALPLAVLTRTPAVDALKYSFELVKPQLGSVVVFVLALVLANVLGALMCGVGLLVSIPASIGAFVLVLAKLFGISRQALPVGDSGPRPT